MTREVIERSQVLRILQALQPDITGFRWEVCGDGLDAAESYGNLFLLLPSGEEMAANEFQRYSLTREVMDALENTLYNASWGDVTVRV